MTLAVALAESGVLSRHGLLCASCHKDPKRKAKLGCGVPPIIETMDRRGPITISLTRAWIADAAREANMLPTAEFVARWYIYAGLGHIDAILGETWDCCPRYYSELAPVEGRMIAVEAVAAARDVAVRHLPLPPEWGDRSLSERGRRILRVAADALRWIQSDADKPAATPPPPTARRSMR